MLDNFLHSGYEFKEDENLQKFRFSLLNSILIIATLFTFINYLADVYGLITFTDLYSKALLLYATINIISIFLLRKNKDYYIISGYVTIISAVLLFYFALFETPDNELRIIWFLIVVYVSFVLFGKRFGIYYTLINFTTILLISITFDLRYSDIALFSFFNSFLILASISYFLFKKIERDAEEFKVLNNKLKEKVDKEVKQREVQEKMLLHQCRLASMGEMIDSIAHQWRQPLMNVNAILMNMDRQIELQEDNTQAKKNIQAYLGKKMDEVITLTSHMSQTIEDFRTLFKTDKEKTYFEVAESINYSVELMKPALKEIDFTFNVFEKHMHYGHRNELTQVIMILLNNAIDVLADKDKKNIDILVKENRELIEISIEDSGGGIDTKHLHFIFDPYYTTKQGAGGTGLGLYIAKIIVEQNMNGTLSAINTEKGAKFIMTLQK